jgi:DNA (cytosine-5)-methyltransferase 1
VRGVQPRYVFAENVQREPIERAGVELEAHGYRCKPIKLCPTAMGAAAKRPRWWLLADADSQGERRFAEHAKVASIQAAALADWRLYPGGVLGMAHGVANRGKRLRAIGNGQVPLVAATAWRLLAGTDR